MTRMAITSRIPIPWSDAWKAWAVPWKLVVMEAGGGTRATLSPAAPAGPREIPGWRLKEMVTEGSWPRWFTRRGPTPGVIVATAFKGTRPPAEERTESRGRASGLAWVRGFP